MQNICRSVRFVLVFVLVATAMSAVAQDETASSQLDPATVPLQFVPVAPCRVVDTRNPAGTFGGPSIQGGATPRSFPIAQGSCHIPLGAEAFSFNVTVVPPGPLGYLTIWPTGQQQPYTSILNSFDGRTKANAAIAIAGTGGGAVSVYASDTTDVVLDINGYFVTARTSSLTFYPLPPCRILDTRPESGGTGPLTGGVTKDFPMTNNPACPVPASAKAYSLNISAVPNGPLYYLTAWPASGDNTPPIASTLNDSTGTIVANAAIVAAGVGGDVAIYPTNDTNLIIDINGYFAAPGGQNALSLYLSNPCRALDTRQSGGAFSGFLAVDVKGGPCALPPTAQAYVFNATVLPEGPLWYLTLWPDGGPQPNVSVLNAGDGYTTNNMAIVSTTNGSIDAYASSVTELILDVSNYFAP